MTGDAQANRAVSDLVGFAAVFAIVVLSVALVFTFGVSAIDDVRQSEGVENVERAFDIVADNIADIHRDGAPARSTELDVATGQFALTGKVEIVVSNSTRNVSDSISLTPIAYTSDEDGFYYTNGAVIRTSRDSGVIIRNPPFRFSDEQVVISYVKTVPIGNTTSISGASFRLRASRQGRSVVTENVTKPITFNLSVTSPRHSAWENYFTREVDCLQVIKTNNTVTCQYETDSLFIRRTIVGVRLDD